MPSKRSAVALYRTRLRQLTSRRSPAVLPPVAPPLPPGRVVSLPGRGDVFVRDLHGPTDRLPLLFLHGWTASADLNWYGAFDRFEGERRVVALDHRGHGRGMRSPQPFTFVDCADDAAALLDVLGLDRAIAVGYSMGGPISLILARRHRHRLAGLVLAATALRFSETWSERVRWKGIAMLELGVRAGWGDRIVAKLAEDLGRVDPAFAPHSSWLAAEFSRTHPRALRQAGAELGRFDARTWAGALRLPASVVVTEGDSLVPPKRQRALAQLLGASVHPLADADHDVPITDVASFSGAVRAAVEAVDPRVEAGVATVGAISSSGPTDLGAISSSGPTDLGATSSSGPTDLGAISSSGPTDLGAISSSGPTDLGSTDLEVTGLGRTSPGPTGLEATG